MAQPIGRPHDFCLLPMFRVVSSSLPLSPSSRRSHSKQRIPLNLVRGEISVQHRDLRL